VRKNSLWLCDTALNWLLTLYGRFESVEKRSKDSKWIALNNFITNYLGEFKFLSTPMPLLGDSYYSTGSFQYYRKLSLRLTKEYYLVSVDSTDSPIFWPLVLHEMAHCWLGSSHVVNSIYAAHNNNMNGLDREVAENRIEEALCDSLATSLIGPAYPFSFINKLWAQFSREVSNWYPTNEFRIECMANILDELQLTEIANELRMIVNEKFSNSWNNEEIACVIDDLAQTTKEFSRTLPKISSKIGIEAENACSALDKSPPKDMPTLFFSCWKLLDKMEPSKIPTELNRITDILLKALKR
jgi:hypothetical protein